MKEPMEILYRCAVCDPKLYQPVLVYVGSAIRDLDFVSGMKQVQELIRHHHKIKHPECLASKDGSHVCVDFLLRMIQ